MAFRAFRFRLYPTAPQALLLSKHFGCARWAYNHGLERKNTEYAKGNKVSHHALVTELPSLKKEFPWLSEVNAQSLQSALRNLDVAFTRFFEKKADAPVFKSRHGRQSFQCPQACSIDTEKGLLFIPKFREGIRAVFHRDTAGKQKTFTLSRDRAGNHWVSILCETGADPVPAPITEARAIGVDLGLKSFAVLSDGRKFDAPKFLRKHEGRIKVLQRQFARKVGGKGTKWSKRKERARLRLACLHWRVANRRSDFLHKLSRGLVNESQVDTFCMETLGVKGMLRNHCLAKSISDASWSEFVGMMGFKCQRAGKSLLRIGRFEPSSKTCHHCGILNRDLTLADREWTCPCGNVLDRDVNAAKNIRTMALLALVPNRTSLQGTGSETKQSPPSGRPPRGQLAPASRSDDAGSPRL